METRASQSTTVEYINYTPWPVAGAWQACSIGSTVENADMDLFDDLEVFYNQRRRRTLGQIGPATFERRLTRAA
jgi:hypothetical protein